MGSAFICRKGRNSQNFTVVGGTTQPENPRENTIWVQTDTAIPEYALSPYSQTFIYTGRVWLKTASSGGAVFDALRDNTHTVNLVGAYQYQDGTYARKNAYIYKSGAWTQFSTEVLWLYQLGDECTDITGGWTAYAYRSSGSQSTPQKPTLNKYSASMKVSMEMSYPNYYAGALFTENAIDLKGYTKLCVNIYDASGTAYFRISADKANGYSISGSTAISAAGEYSIDISSIDSGYVAFAIEGATGSVQFNKVWLE